MILREIKHLLMISKPKILDAINHLQTVPVQYSNISLHTSVEKLKSSEEQSETLMNIVLDVPTPKNERLSAKYKRSFAYPSMKDRLPVILSKLVDFLYREKHDIIVNYGEGAQKELKSAIGEISQLKNHVQTGKSFEKFFSADPDTPVWNAYLEELIKKGSKLNYYEADWLFAECYLYRKIREIFATKTCLNPMDPFCYQKTALLSDSLPAIGPVMVHMEEEGLLNASKSLSHMQMKEELCMLLKVSVWNKNYIINNL